MSPPRARTSNCWPRSSGSRTPTRCTLAATSAHEALLGDPSTGQYDGPTRSPCSASPGRRWRRRPSRPALAALGARVSEAAYLVSDVAADLASYAQSVEADPARLAAVQERRAELTRLIRLFGGPAGGPAGVPGPGEAQGPGEAAGAGGAAAAAPAGEAGAAAAPGAPDAAAGGVAAVLALGQAGRAPGSRNWRATTTGSPRLTAQEAELAADLGQLAGQLSAARKEAADRFAADVTAELAALAMPHARLTRGVDAAE